MENRGIIASFLRTNIGIAWTSAGICIVITGVMLTNQNFWKIGQSISGALRGSQTVGIALTALVAIVLAGLASTMAAIILTFIGTKEMRSKLSLVAEACALYSAGKLNYRMTMQGNDDLSIIANKLNLMAERLQDQVAALQEAAKHNAELQKSVETAAVLRERERVRRELHDRVSQELFGLSMLSTTASRLHHKDPDKALDLLPEIEELAKHAQGAMRALLLELRPLELNKRSLIPALKDLAQEMSARTGIEITCADQHAVNNLMKVDSSIEDSLFLIAQEAMVNALRHANPSHVHMEIVMEDVRILLRIVDDGKGFEPEQGKWTSLGLRSMRERAEIVGGSLNVRSVVGRGTEVLCIIPLSEIQGGMTS